MNDEPIHPLQAMVNEMLKQRQIERSTSQMTLGKLIDRLSAMPPDAMIESIEAPHSYRGYYSDLAFESNSGRIPVSAALALCKSAMGEVFQGYKGGDFQMGRNTPLWVANYGDCGQKLMAVRDDGSLELADDEA